VTQYGWLKFNNIPYGWSVDLVTDSESVLAIADWSGGVRREVSRISLGPLAAGSAAYFDKRGTTVYFDQADYDLTQRSNISVIDISSSFGLTINKNLTISAMVAGELIYSLDETVEGYMVGLLSSAGVQVWSLTDPKNPVELANLDTYTTEPDYTAGAQFPCYRGNNQSAIVWQNIEDGYAEVISVLTITGTSPSLVLSRASFNPTGTMWSCASVGSAANRFAVVTTDAGIHYYSVANPTTAAFTIPNSCPIMDWAGRIAGVDLFTHGRASTCNCVNPVTTPCPLGFKVTGDAATLPNITAFGQHFLDGPHWLENAYTTYLGATPVTTLGVVLADGPSPVGADPAILGKFGCHPFTAAGIAAVTGKVCLVYRGTCTFQDKIQNCLAAGAAMVMVVNRPEAGLIYMATDSFNIPVIMVQNEVGEALVQALNAPPPPPPTPTPITQRQPPADMGMTVRLNFVEVLAIFACAFVAVLKF
jgi:hypothetical protein